MRPATWKLIMNVAVAVALSMTWACGSGITTADDDHEVIDAGDQEPTEDGSPVVECTCPGCQEQWVGVGTPRPFDTQADESEFVLSAKGRRRTGS